MVDLEEDRELRVVIVLRVNFGVNLAAPVIRGITGMSVTAMPTLKDANLHRLELADRSWKALRPASAGHDADLDLGLTEFRIF